MWWGVRTPHDHHLEHSDIQTDIMGDLPMKTPAHQDSVKQLLQLCRWLISVPSRLQLAAPLCGTPRLRGVGPGPGTSPPRSEGQDYLAIGIKRTGGE